MPLVKALLGLATDMEVYRASKAKVLGDREYLTCAFEDTVGIEVEVENAHELAGRNAPAGWSTVADGSLRNGGTEFISKPTDARTIHLSLARLLDGHFDNKVQSFSPRTSIHVHVNCRDMEMATVQNIIRYYSLFERLLFRFCGRSRYKNIYCVPLVDTSILTAFDTKFPNTRAWPKYAGLNAAPLTTYGTLEFRHMHGTFDVDKLMVWINLLLSVVNYAKDKKTDAVVKEIVLCADESAFLNLMDRVFGSFRNQLQYKTEADYYHCYNNVLESFQSAHAPHDLGAKAAIRERLT